MTDADFLFNLKAQASGGRGLNLTHECAIKLLAMATRQSKPLQLFPKPTGDEWPIEAGVAAGCDNG